MNSPEPDWLRWGKELAALAQSGIAYSAEKPFDMERYLRIRQIAADILASKGSMDAPQLMALLNREEGYATPKVDIRAFVQKSGGEVLLVQEKVDSRWTLPGGWADVNDTPGQVAAREVWEEACVTVRPVRLLAMLDRSAQGQKPPFPFHIYKVFFQCEMVAGEPAPGSETLAASWFPLTALPPLSEGRVLPRQIARMAELVANPTLPPDFD